MAASDDESIPSLNQARAWHLSSVGLVFMALAFAASLTPSLVPKTPLVQGVLSGVIMAVAYAIGSSVYWLWQVMLLPEIRLGRWRVAIFLFVIGVAAAALVNVEDWENATRAVTGMPPVEATDPFLIAVLSLVVFLVLWALGTVVTTTMRFAGRALSRLLPGRLGPFLGGILALVIFFMLVDGVLVRRGLDIADRAFAAGELVFDPRFEAPEDPMMTGSPASLIGWDDLGNRGRDFVGRTPSIEDISEFTGAPAQKPVRVYVGRVSADTARERAELALEELIRVGGFEREILIVTTPVGTGWMDPGAHDTIDFMYGGDTAHVGAQYSYLTSVLSILTNVEYGFEQARALFDVIYDYWEELPEDNRPRLFIHGLSQGALNSQAVYPFFDVLADPPQGAFWVGSPFISPIWTRVRDNRNEGSLSWLPRFGNGSLVRVGTQFDAYEPADARWGPVRFVFLHHGSDPLVVFDWTIIWKRPDWLGAARPADIAPEMRWYPVVTALQLALDMMHPIHVERFGHFYVAEDYIDGWALLTDPPDWTAAKSTRLKEIFETRPAPW